MKLIETLNRGVVSRQVCCHCQRDREDPQIAAGHHRHELLDQLVRLESLLRMSCCCVLVALQWPLSCRALVGCMRKGLVAGIAPLEI